MPLLSPEDVIPLHLADITFPATHPLHGQTGAMLGFAIRHQTGVILFDTGIGRGNDALDRYYQVVHRPIEAELERYEHAMGEVRVIVNSHLHFDHCGNNHLFPGVPIYVQTAELEAAGRPRYTVREWVDFEGAEYRTIDGDVEVAGGIRIVSTPGHTPGHQSIVIDTRQGDVVLAGQAIYCKPEHDHISATGELWAELPPVTGEADSYLASALRLIALRPHRIHFSHDPEIVEAGPPT